MSTEAEQDWPGPCLLGGAEEGRMWTGTQRSVFYEENAERREPVKAAVWWRLLPLM